MHLLATEQNFDQEAFDMFESLIEERQQYTSSGVPWTSFAVCSTIIESLPSLDGNILVVANIELALVLVSKYKVSPESITFIALCEYSYNWGISAASKKILNGMNVIDGNDINFFNTVLNMEFDVILGNPPYNKGMLSHKVKGTNGYPHLVFLDKLLPHLIPSGVLRFLMPTGLLTLSSLSKYRQKLINEYNVLDVTILNNQDKSIFDIEKFENILLLTLTTGVTAETTITRENYNKQSSTVKVDLKKYEYWPLYFNQMSVDIFNKVQDMKTGDIPYLARMATEHFIYLAVMGDNNSYNHTKRWHTSDAANFGAPIYMYFDNLQERDLYFEFTQTKLYNYLLSILKSTPKNQPQFMSYIGKQAFVDNDFYKHFNLTKKEIDYIENFKK